MYAIRSYYGPRCARRLWIGAHLRRSGNRLDNIINTEDKKMEELIIKNLMEQLDLSREEITPDSSFVDDFEMDRITSYNVCYTKLLRTSDCYR